jgi:hypothetical protein
MEAVLKSTTPNAITKVLWPNFTVNESLKKAHEFSILKQSTVLAYMDIFYT